MHRWVWRLLEGAAIAVAVFGAVLLITAAPRTAGSQVGTPVEVAALGPTGLAGAFARGTTWIDTGDRATVVAVHQAEYAAVPPVLAWVGDLDGCQEGATSTDYRRATIDRVNFYRAMAGVPAIVSEDPDLSAKAQEAALMMSAEGALTHHPGDDFACFSTVGQEAAGNSNLYLGRTGPVAIDGYIEDPGENNNDVGHRNTILHPPTRAMGVGDIAASDLGHAANALWVFDEHVFDEASDLDRPPMRERDRFVAWPPRGYVPPELVYPRWSFTQAGADFSRAQVTVYDLSDPAGARPVPLEVVSRSGVLGHVPLPTVVWEPTLSMEPDRDTSYYVVITGIGRLDNGPAGTDGGADPAAAQDDQTGEVAYTVTVLGAEPGADVAPERFLASITARR
ncbi:MAG: CAP domain-containing protein [Actinomycetota bacterium]